MKESILFCRLSSKASDNFHGKTFRDLCLSLSLSISFDRIIHINKVDSRPSTWQKQFLGYKQYFYAASLDWHSVKEFLIETFFFSKIHFNKEISWCIKRMSAKFPSNSGIPEGNMMPYYHYYYFYLNYFFGDMGC